jgi:hypothetical protein
VSAFAHFSTSSRWRFWCHCISVRSIEKMGDFGDRFPGFRRDPTRISSKAAVIGRQPDPVGRVWWVYG